MAHSRFFARYSTGTGQAVIPLGKEVSSDDLQRVTEGAGAVHRDG